MDELKALIHSLGRWGVFRFLVLLVVYIAILIELANRWNHSYFYQAPYLNYVLFIFILTFLMDLWMINILSKSDEFDRKNQKSIRYCIHIALLIGVFVYSGYQFKNGYSDRYVEIVFDHTTGSVHNIACKQYIGHYCESLVISQNEYKASKGDLYLNEYLSEDVSKYSECGYCNPFIHPHYGDKVPRRPDPERDLGDYDQGR